MQTQAIQVVNPIGTGSHDPKPVCACYPLSDSPGTISPRSLYVWRGAGSCSLGHLRTQPVDLAIGDHGAITLAAHLLSHEYLWRWDTRMLAKGRADGLKAAFEQSALKGLPLSLAQLRKRTGKYSPRLNEEGRRCSV